MYQHPSQLRLANVRRAFRLLLERGPCSRAELARLSGLSPVTAGKLFDGMLHDGWVEEIEVLGRPAQPGGTRGRPPRLVRLSGVFRLPVLEVGVRETAVRMVGLSEARTIDVESSMDQAAVRFATPRSTRSMLEELRRVRRAIGCGKVPAVLASLPGVIRPAAGEILFSPNLKWTRGTKLLDGIGRVFQARVCAVQEIQALALGELAHSGGPESFVLVDFGDGVGGAVVTKGQLLHGPQPLCGELGHTGVFGNRRPCGCGSVGCLETLVSRSGILRSYRAARRSPRAAWEACAEHVARRGVEAWLEKAIDAAATIIGGAINLVGVSDIVLTGELPGLHPEVLAHFGRRIREHALIGRFARLACHHVPRRRILGLVAAAADRFLLPDPARSGSVAKAS